MEPFKLRVSLRTKKSKIVSPVKVKQKKPQTNAERSANYRKKLMENPERWAAVRAIFNEKQRINRAARSDEKRLHDNLTAKICMQKYSARKKEKLALGEINPKPPTLRPIPVTRQQKEKSKISQEIQRKAWREAKKKYRDGLSSQKQRRLKEKRQKKYLEKKQLALISKSTYVKRKCLSRVKAVMPKSPSKYGAIMLKLIETATPRKVAELHKCGIVTARRELVLNNIVDGIKETIKRIAINRKRKSIIQKRQFVSGFSIIKKYTTLKPISKHLGINYKFLRKWSDIKKASEILKIKRRSDALSEDVETNVQKFYKRPDNSMELPTKRSVSVKKKKQKKVLDKSLKQLYNDFKTENPEIQMSLDRFRRARPKHIETMKKNNLLTCLCEKCANINLKLEAIKNLLFKNKFENFQINNHHEAMKITLCERRKGNKFHRMCCLKRTCSSCGMKQLSLKFAPMLEKYKDEIILWNVWGNVTVQNETGKKTTKKELLNKNATLNEMIKEFMIELQALTMHLFSAKWQYIQYVQLKENLYWHPHWVVLVVDFSENYSCVYQKEIQPMYWSHKQVTLFPVVAHYKCTNQGCNLLVTENLVFLSNDLVHDSHAVHHFLTIANKYLSSQIGGIELEIQFCDNCTGQFKSKTPLADISFSQTDFGFPIHRNYFEARHGKGPCDGLGGIVKQMATQAVINKNTIIRDAKEMYKFCCETLTLPKPENISSDCCHNFRQFFFVEKNAINRKRANRMIKTVAGTRNLKSVKSIKDYLIHTRALSCYCEFCIDGGETTCKNRSYIAKWKPVSLKIEKKEVAKLAEQIDLSQQNYTVLQEADNLDITENLPIYEQPNDIPYLSLSFEGIIPLKKDSYVAVNWGKPESVWVAKIEDISEDAVDSVTVVNVLLKFMHHERFGYVWPDVDDFSWEPASSIIATLQEPILNEKRSNNRTQYFCFGDSILSRN